MNNNLVPFGGGVHLLHFLLVELTMRTWLGVINTHWCGSLNQAIMFVRNFHLLHDHLAPLMAYPTGVHNMSTLKTGSLFNSLKFNLLVTLYMVYSNRRGQYSVHETHSVNLDTTKPYFTM